jgi:hypothetical protein
MNLENKKELYNTFQKRRDIFFEDFYRIFNIEDIKNLGKQFNLDLVITYKKNALNKIFNKISEENVDILLEAGFRKWERSAWKEQNKNFIIYLERSGYIFEDNQIAKKGIPIIDQDILVKNIRDKLVVGNKSL